MTAINIHVNTRMPTIDVSETHKSINTLWYRPASFVFLCALVLCAGLMARDDSGKISPIFLDQAEKPILAGGNELYRVTTEGRRAKALPHPDPEQWKFTANLSSAELATSLLTSSVTPTVICGATRFSRFQRPSPRAPPLA
ncbi:hypothetical protein TDB9533_04663 [Thalassocella blandensis]|nr:hypothetical protein TDB9533_04663 [Thalassocella blandensis]